MRHFERHSVFSPAVTEATPACLAGWHSRWLVGRPVRPDSSTFLRSLRSVPVTGLRRYYGRSDSCEAGSSAPAFGQHERRFSPPQVSLIHVSDLPIPPSPTTPQALDVDFARYPSSRRVSHLHGSRLHLFPAGSPTLTGRIEFVILRMDRSPPAAPHPASRRRSCSRLQAGERIPEEDLHLSDQTRFQAHWNPRSARVFGYRFRDRSAPESLDSSFSQLSPRGNSVRPTQRALSGVRPPNEHAREPGFEWKAPPGG
jgi:hypothetical protein